MARKLHPGQKNNLDALCRRYGTDNSHRDLHGALLDAEILADVYLLMTGGQTSLSLSNDLTSGATSDTDTSIRRLKAGRDDLTIISATEDELLAHDERLDKMANSTDVVWRT